MYQQKSMRRFLRWCGVVCLGLTGGRGGRWLGWWLGEKSGSVSWRFYDPGVL